MINIESYKMVVNYSLVHCGLPVASSLVVHNNSCANTQQMVGEALIPGYTLPSEIVVPELKSGERRDLASDFTLRFLPDVVSTQMERARATLQIRFPDNPTAQFPIWVLAYSEVSLLPGHEATLAAFVFPNNPAVRVVATKALEKLPAIDGRKSFFEFIETSNGEAIDIIAKAIHDCLCTSFRLTYDYEPPSWELNSQNIRFPDEVLADMRGTCMDLALLFASVLENVLVSAVPQPVLGILESGGSDLHSVVGCWRRNPSDSSVVIRDVNQIINKVENGDLLLFDSTSFVALGARRPQPTSFETSRSDALERLRSSTNIALVSIGAARPGKTGSPDITPLPFRKEPALGQSALEALWRARSVWTSASTEVVQGAHLLAGLLFNEDKQVFAFFRTFAEETMNPKVSPRKLRKYLLRGLERVPGNVTGGAVDSSTVTMAKHRAKTESTRMGDSFVEDIHLLYALLRNPGVSVEKALLQRETSAAECLHFLEELYPPVMTTPISRFPSEVSEA